MFICVLKWNRLELKNWNPDFTEKLKSLSSPSAPTPKTNAQNPSMKYAAVCYDKIHLIILRFARTIDLPFGNLWFPMVPMLNIIPSSGGLNNVWLWVDKIFCGKPSISKLELDVGFLASLLAPKANKGVVFGPKVKLGGELTEGSKLNTSWTTLSWFVENTDDAIGRLELEFELINLEFELELELEFE